MKEDCGHENRALVSDEGRGVGILHLRQPHANDCARTARTL